MIEQKQKQTRTNTNKYKQQEQTQQILKPQKHIFVKQEQDKTRTYT